jgi:hypothetical protein
MPQMANTDGKKVTDAVKAVGDRVADNTRAMVDKGRDMARDVEETTVSMVEQTAAKSAAAARQAAGPILQLAEATPAVGKDLTGFWLDLVQGQLAHNVDAFRRFSTARDWRERLDVQGSYFSGNLARMSEAASRYAELAGKMMQGLLRTGSDEIRKAG